MGVGTIGGTVVERLVVDLKLESVGVTDEAMDLIMFSFVVLEDGTYGNLFLESLFIVVLMSV